MISIQISNLFTDSHLYTFIKDMADPEFQFLFLSSGARKSKGTLDKLVWDRFSLYGEKFNISMPDHLPGEINSSIQSFWIAPSCTSLMSTAAELEADENVAVTSVLTPGKSFSSTASRLIIYI